MIGRDMAATGAAVLPRVIRAGGIALAGSVLLWASARLQVPFWPVPMTLQTLVVLGLGFALGGRLAAAAVALYLLEGALGMPVFAGTPERGIGLAYMVGPTGGYLAGYLVAAALVGWLADRGFARSLPRALVAALAGTVAIYALGLSWLGSVIGWDKPVLELGLLPFLAGDAVKLAIAATAATAASGLRARWR